MDQPDRAAWPRAGDEVARPAAERVRRIVAAAEAEAADIRYEADAYATARRREAEEEAERILAEAMRSADELVLARVRRISELSDEIVDRAHRISGAFESAERAKQRLERLVEALSEVAERVAEEASAPPEPPVRAVPPPPEPSANPELESARLVALQMALDGRTRGEIEAEIDGQFGVDDPARIVEEVLGVAGSRRLIEKRRDA